MNPDGDLIEDFLAALALQGRAAKTIRTYGVVLWAAHRELPHGVPTATGDEIAMWLTPYRDPATKRTYLAAFRAFAAWAVITGHLDRDEARTLRRPPQPAGLPNPCTDDQLATILQRARQPCRSWSTMAAYAGLRCCEIAGLHREHVTEGRLRVVRGKGGKARVVPTHPAVWKAVAGLPAGTVAPGRSGDYVSGRLRAEYLALGVDVTAHQLRHWYGTTLVANGASIEEVQVLMGHSRITTTLGYVLVAGPRLAAAVARLPALNAACAAAPDPAAGRSGR